MENKKPRKAKAVKTKKEVVKEPKLIHCITTDAYKKLKVRDKELGYIPEPNTELTITKERFEILQNNKFGVAFVKEIREEE